jgi:hypothetical protein
VRFPPEIDDIVGPFYDRQGALIGFERFAALKFVDDGERNDIVAVDEFENATISTVWLGWREGVDDQGRPRIFETMVLAEDSARVHGRYATEDEAVAGHAAVLDHVQSRGRRAD